MADGELMVFEAVYRDNRPPGVWALDARNVHLLWERFLHGNESEPISQLHDGIDP